MRTCRIRGRSRGRGNLIEAGRAAPRCRRCGATSASGCSARTSRAADCGASTRISRRVRRPERVVSTPISESTIMGAGLGSALVGMRPIIEMRIFDFVMCAMDELVNQIAKIRYMFGGQAKPAVVVRMPHGMWRNSAAQHCADAGSLVRASAGRRRGDTVATPSRRRPDCWCRRSARTIRCCSSIRRICVRPNGEMAEPIEPIPFGEARRCARAMPRRWCRGLPMMPKAIEAADRLTKDGIKVDLLDLRTIWPWDEDTIDRLGQDAPAVCWWCTRPWRSAASAPRSSRRVVDRLGPTGLKAAKRLGAPRIPIPFAPPLENEVRVTADKIVAIARSMVS